MRLIGTLQDEKQGRLFSRFLEQKGITYQLEAVTDTDWGSANYGSTQYRVWIYDEDQVDDAIGWYNFFIEHPNDPVFTSPSYTLFPPTASKQQEEGPPEVKVEEGSSPTTSKWAQQPLGPITRLLIIVCCGLTMLSWFLTSTKESSQETAFVALFSSPLEKTILYDYPYVYELISQFIDAYGYEALDHPENLSPEAQALFQKIQNTPYWQGLYTIVQKEGVRAIWQPKTYQVPMFEKIRQGELWRFFSPTIFHAEFFHLFFNMIWLLVLGKQIEQRLGSGRYIFFILIVALFSNTAEYLMGGPNFLGFSGVLCGMLTFIWMRQRYAPWEGYQLDRVTIIFLLLFILSMAGVQLISFFLEKSLSLSISPGIANTAHLSGALLGLILGRLNVFSWRHV